MQSIAFAVFSNTDFQSKNAWWGHSIVDRIANRVSVLRIDELRELDGASTIQNLRLMSHIYNRRRGVTGAYSRFAGASAVLTMSIDRAPWLLPRG